MRERVSQCGGTYALWGNTVKKTQRPKAVAPPKETRGAHHDGHLLRNPGHLVFLHELLQKMESERGVLILEAVFCEDAVRAALGIGKILTQFVVLWTIRLCCWSILCEKWIRS